MVGWWVASLRREAAGDPARERAALALPYWRDETGGGKDTPGRSGSGGSESGPTPASGVPGLADEDAAIVV